VTFGLWCSRCQGKVNPVMKTGDVFSTVGKVSTVTSLVLTISTSLSHSIRVQVGGFLERQLAQFVVGGT